MEGIGFRDGEKTSFTATRPIAIVGTSCRLPGGPNLAALRQLLPKGRDAIAEIPDDRWAKPLYFHSYLGQRGRSSTFTTGVLDNVCGFDAGLFGISPTVSGADGPAAAAMPRLAEVAVARSLDKTRGVARRLNILERKLMN